jgi:hypothetical protein
VQQLEQMTHRRPEKEEEEEEEEEERFPHFNLRGCRERKNVAPISRNPELLLIILARATVDERKGPRAKLPPGKSRFTAAGH